MEPQSIAEALTGLNAQQQLYVTWVVFGLKMASELWSSIRNGGGLRKILLSFWFGENLPRPLAEDYKKELEADKRIL